MSLQIFLHRKRKMLTRLVALLALGLGGMFALLPRADAHVPEVTGDPAKSFLLSPERLSGERFAAFYVVAHR